MKADQVILVEHHKPQAVIVLGGEATTVERHAAEEFRRIVQEMTGAALPVVSEDELGRHPAATAILIGRSETNPRLKPLVEAGLVKLSADDPGLDGYVMAAARHEGRTYLVLGGSQDRSALYAVYHFLEKYGGCGWWFDGDTIPKTDSLAIPMIQDRVRPRFENRLGNGWFYDNDFWTADDWKHYLDYLAKRRMNTVFGFGKIPYQPLVLQRMGMDVQLTPFEKKQLENARQYIAYARQELGLRIAHPSLYINSWWRGENAQRFYLKHKDDIRWIKQEWGGFTYHIMHPKDPMFRNLNEALIKTCIEDFGTDHLYQISTTSEETTDLPLDKIPQTIADSAHESLEVVRKVDPQARFLLDWWCLVASESGGQRQAYALGSLQVLRNEPDTIGQEIASESASSDHPFYYDLYSDTNGYYYGRPWHAGIFQGGSSALRMYGDIPRLIWQFRSLADDPKAHNLRGVFLTPESGHNHNFLWFDCATQLIFDPKQVDLDTLSKRFALRRYGPKGEPLAKAVELLLQTVYSSFNSSLYNRPFYYIWEGRGCWTPIAEQNKLMISYSPKLAQALQIVLGQESALGNAPHYKRDLIDLGLQYLGGRGTDYYWRMVQAYKDKDVEAFQRWAGRAMEMMDYQARLAGAWPDFRLSTYESKAMEWPTLDPMQDWNFGSAQLVPKGFDNAMFYRVLHTTLFYPNNWMLDYAARDWAELIAYVYKPELDLRAKAMWKELTQGQAIPQAALEHKKTGYLMDFQSQSPFPDENAIYHKFIKEGYPKMEYYEGSVPDLVKEILQRFPPEEQ